MCISNGGDCSVFKHYTSYQVRCNLIGKCSEVRHYSYTEPLWLILIKLNLPVNASIMTILKITLSKLVWFITMLIALNACQKKDTLTILSGVLQTSQNEVITLVNCKYYFPGFVNEKMLIETNTDSTGFFIFKTNLTEPGYYQILILNYPILTYDVFLEPGDSIHLELPNWNQNPDLKISGKGASKLNYLVKDFEILYKNRTYRDTIRSNGFETEMLFKAYVDSIKNLRIKELGANEFTPDNLKSRFLNVIQADLAETLLSHLENRNRYMEGTYDYFYPDTSYYSFLVNMHFDSLFCESSEAKNLAGLFLENKARTAYKERSEEEWWDENLSWKLNYIIEQPKSIWTDYLALSTISEYSFGMFLDNFFENLLEFKERIDELFYHDINKKLFQEGVSDYIKLAPGELAPDFALPDADGNIVHLSDFKGKIIYMDFWGTWCYPCIQDIPDALKLQEHYKDKPVVFLYVSMEYDEENIANWKQFINGKDERFGEYLNHEPFPGVHVVAEKQFLNQEIKPYKIIFAPTHVLIDHNGNIVSVRAKRPNKISEDIDKLLKK